MNRLPPSRTSLWFSLPERSGLEELPRGVKRDLLTGFEELVSAASREALIWSGPTGVEVRVSPAEVLLTEYEMDHQKVGISLKVHSVRVRELVKDEACRLAERESRRWKAVLARVVNWLTGGNPAELAQRRILAYQDGLAMVLEAGIIMEVSRRINFLVVNAGSGMSPTLTKALEDLGRAMGELDTPGAPPSPKDMA